MLVGAMAKHLLAVLLLLELHRPLLQLGGPIIVTTGLGGPSKRLVLPPPTLRSTR